MAVSKIIPIKSTLDMAISYICDSDKTDGLILTDSYGCTPRTADIEMAMTAEKGRKKGNRIAYHLMQSFSPEDNISPEKAMELGRQFVLEMTKGNHEFVMATHINEEHIHNHIIFNATSFKDYKKYHHDKKDINRMHKINDRICKENNLSIIENKSGKKGISKYEHEKKKRGESWKAKLVQDIDIAISGATNFQNFINIMQEKGYEIKQGKYLSFKAPGQEKFIRNRSLGEAYTMDNIKKRIEDKGIKKEAFRKKRNINLMADISKNIKAQQSKGYATVLTKSNINTLVKTMNFLSRNNIQTVDEFKQYYNDFKEKYNFALMDRKTLQSQTTRLSEQMKFLKNYKDNKYIYIKLQYAKDKNEYIEKNRKELLLFESAKEYFQKIGLDPDQLKRSDLFEKLKKLKEEKEDNYSYMQNAKAEFSEVDIIKKNIEMALEISLDSIDMEAEQKESIMERLEYFDRIVKEERKNENVLDMEREKG